jgi:predicted transposase YdaD
VEYNTVEMGTITKINVKWKYGKKKKEREGKKRGRNSGKEKNLNRKEGKKKNFSIDARLQGRK